MYCRLYEPHSRWVEPKAFRLRRGIEIGRGKSCCPLSAKDVFVAQLPIIWKQVPFPCMSKIVGSAEGVPAGNMRPQGDIRVPSESTACLESKASGQDFLSRAAATYDQASMLKVLVVVIHTNPAECSCDASKTITSTVALQRTQRQDTVGLLSVNLHVVGAVAPRCQAAGQ